MGKKKDRVACKSRGFAGLWKEERVACRKNPRKIKKNGKRGEAQKGGGEFDLEGLNR